MATPYYYKQLRKISSESGIAFIVDETRTGMGITGKWWGHENWYLSQPADIVTFGGASGISGFYHTEGFDLNSHGAGFAQVIDQNKLLNFGNIWRTVQSGKLLERTMDASSMLKIELDHISKEQGRISQVRGAGLFLAFDTEHPDAFQRYAYKCGMNIPRVGKNTFGIRAAMVMGPL